MLPSTPYQKLFLKCLAWTAEDGGISLFEALKATARARIQDTETGTILVGTSGNGASASFQIPRQESVTPETLANMCSRLLDLYDAAKASLGGSPSDDVILAWMLSRMIPIRRVYPSFSGIFR